MMNPIPLAVPAQPLETILKLSQPLVPQFRFEWHPRTKRVYTIRVGATPEVGELIAFDVENHGQAINAVNIWCRGYRTAVAGRPVPGLVL
jgi:hypothetical protein